MNLLKLAALAFVSTTAMQAFASRGNVSDELLGPTSGIASIYGEPQGLATGGRLDPKALTCAHQTLPFGTVLLVTNNNNGHSVVVIVNDRGPFAKHRILDLTPAAGRVIGVYDLGSVSIEILGMAPLYPPKT